MINFFSAMLSALQTMIQVVINFVAGILSLLTYIPLAAQAMTTTIGLLPTVLTGFATALISVSIAYLIIGR